MSTFPPEIPRRDVHVASLVLNELQRCRAELTGTKAEAVQKAITYMSNHLALMRYTIAN